MLDILKTRRRVIVLVEIGRRGASRPMIQRAAQEGQALLASFQLHSLIISDSAVGGVTDGPHLLGFRDDLGSSVTPMIELGLPLVLSHFLDGGVTGPFPTVLKTSLPPLDTPACTVLMHNGIVQAEGLLPCLAPDTLVYAPSYKLCEQWATRQLTVLEQLRLCQLPLSMDPLMSGLRPSRTFPFEDSLSPEVFTSVFRQLWGTCVGGYAAKEEKGIEEDSEKGIVEVEDESVDVEEKGIVDEVEEKGIMEVEDDSVDVEEKGIVEVEDDLIGTPEGAASDNCVISCGGDDLMTVAMTSSYRPDTSLPPTESSNWELDLDVMLGWKDGSLLTDKDTVTSLASEETLCRGRTHWGNRIKEHEIRPSPTNNPGPPFMVGDVILCDIPGQLWGMDPKVNWLQRGFVMQAKDPSYKIRLEQGVTVWTNMN